VSHHQVRFDLQPVFLSCRSSEGAVKLFTRFLVYLASVALEGDIWGGLGFDGLESGEGTSLDFFWREVWDLKRGDGRRDGGGRDLTYMHLHLHLTNA